jgi:hypothetical protein
MFQDKNRVVAPPVTPKGWGGGLTQNLMIILKILRICNVNSKINLKITVELKSLCEILVNMIFLIFLWTWLVPD